MKLYLVHIDKSDDDFPDSRRYDSEAYLVRDLSYSRVISRVKRKLDNPHEWTVEDVMDGGKHIFFDENPRGSRCSGSWSGNIHIKHINEVRGYAVTLERK